jgi:hypothetical protein
VGIIGARRQRQGLGPFVARDLRAAGAEIPCFLATTAETRDDAAGQLASRYQIEARGYLDLEAMLSTEDLDALAILSPAETHRPYLEAAHAAGLHALCEKPLIWGGRGLATAAARIARDFDARGLLLWENCQWPYTLPAYEQLHPGSTARAPERFEMHLQPTSSGIQMLVDSMPHVLSLLQALSPSPAPSIAEPLFSAPDAERMTVGFLYCAGSARLNVQVRLERANAAPREAGFAVDGRPVRRLVAPKGYRLSFAAGDRTAPVADPLTLLVGDFIQELQSRRGASRSREIAERMQLLEAIVDAYAAHTGLERV